MTNTENLVHAMDFNDIEAINEIMTTNSFTLSELESVVEATKTDDIFVFSAGIFGDSFRIGKAFETPNGDLDNWILEFPISK